MELVCIPVTPFFTNCYVVKDRGEAIVIDPGEASPELMRNIADSKVVMIFNTHCHCDHSGGNAELVRATGAPLACHEADLPLLRAVPDQGRMFGVSFPASPEPDRLVEPGEWIHVGGLSFEVRHTPGHSPGHVSLVCPGMAIVGDVLFEGSIGRTDLPGGSMAQLLQSIKRELMTLPDDTLVYSGHGPSTTIGKERASNPFLVN